MLHNYFKKIMGKIDHNVQTSKPNKVNNLNELKHD